MQSLSEGRSFNYGLALLKSLMCFEVVLDHFWMEDASIYLMPFKAMGLVAVPIFMFISFYLTERIFLDSDGKRIKKRIWRVCWPQIGWALIYYLAFKIAQLKINFGVRFKDFIWQIITGHSPVINQSMWFQTVLIVLTLVYFLIFKFMKTEKGIAVTYVMMFLALIIQYTGINIKLFNSLRYELKYPLGRFCEMVPYATLGFSCAYYNVFEKIKSYVSTTKIFFLIMFGMNFIFLFNYEVINAAPGFGYSNNNFIPISLFMTGFAFLIPFENLSEKIKRVIKFFTGYTLGIYCMHRLVGEFFLRIFPKLGIEVNGFVLCIVIYIVSFIISYVMYRIPLKLIKQLVN